MSDDLRVNTIAVDGPAASGKSTAGQLVARELGYLFFDTGVMYRAITLAALEAGVSVFDELGCTKLAEETQIDVQPPSIEDGRLNDILIDGVDKTWDIRTPEVDANVSEVSTYAGVRSALTAQQRKIGVRGRVIMVGRDIGTVVMPDAILKIYLDASAEERAGRRHHERIERGEESDFEQVLSIVQKRDQIDSSREVAPLCAAEDAVVINSDQMSIEEVFEAIMQLVREAGLA
ncbi:MAG: (d)CMP kinase [Anaerolineales bacterium]|nr:(d)CMP kinase [Anaerolineales bacterium]